MGTLLTVAMVVLAAPQYDQGPAPTWVKPEPVPALPARAGGSAVQLLRDRQVRVADAVESYTHTAWQALNTSGVDEVAHQSFEWDPGFETLTLHGLWRVRDGQREQVWHDEDARVLQREVDLEDRIYDGRLSLEVELRDVRPGDVIEAAWTVRGENPVFQQHFAGTFGQATDNRVVREAFRLLWARGRPLQLKLQGGAVAPAVDRRDGEVAYSWHLDDVAEVDVDRYLPIEVPQFPHVEFSDWRDWNEVARWADALFTVKAGAARFDQVVAKLKATPDAERLQAAVRFAQDDIRYTGVELGEHSHQPHSPAWVLERGFGDCKDKALLLVSLLRALGYDAAPALVHTAWGKSLPQSLPSPLAFNHAIVRLSGKQPRFVDATSTHLRGAVEKWPQPRFGAALVVSPQTTGLEAIPQPKEPPLSYRVTQTWSVPSYLGPAEVLLETETWGDDARGLRRRLTGSDKESLVRDYQKRREAQLDLPLAPLAFDWTDEGDRVLLREKYSAEKFFDERWRHSFYTLYLDEQLPPPPPGERTEPFALPDPMQFEERIVWNAPERLLSAGFALLPTTVDNPAFRFTTQHSVSGKTLKLGFKLVTLADRVEGGALGRYKIDREAMRDVTGYSVETPPGSTVARPLEPGPKTTLGDVLMVVALAAVVLGGFAAWPRLADWRARAKSARFRKKQVHSAGEGPDNPAVLGSVDAARSLFSSRTCPKGHAWADAVEQQRPVTFGGERIDVVARKCSACDAAEHRYVRLRFLK